MQGMMITPSSNVHGLRNQTTTETFAQPQPYVAPIQSNASGRASSRSSSRVPRSHRSNEKDQSKKAKKSPEKEEIKLPTEPLLVFEKDGGVSTRRQNKLVLKQNRDYLNKIEQSGLPEALHPTMSMRSDERMHEALPSVGYSISRNSAVSKGGHSMVNPSSSASRSRPSEHPYGAEKDDISIKFQSSNHDEPSNYEPVAQNNEMFAPGSGFPHSKKSGLTKNKNPA